MDPDASAGETRTYEHDLFDRLYNHTRRRFAVDALEQDIEEVEIDITIRTETVCIPTRGPRPLTWQEHVLEPTYRAEDDAAEIIYEGQSSTVYSRFEDSFDNFVEEVQRDGPDALEEGDYAENIASAISSLEDAGLDVKAGDVEDYR